MRTHLKNARLIDGTGTRPIDGASLIIERDTIVHAGALAPGDAPTDTPVIDIAGKTVIPGLIEAHLHLSYNNVKAIADLDLNCPPEYSTLVSAMSASPSIPSLRYDGFQSAIPPVAQMSRPAARRRGPG